MAIINITTNVDNFTVEHDSIVKDHAFNDLNSYYDSDDNNTVFLTWRRSDNPSGLRIDATGDTIDINGTTVFADAAAIATALRLAMFKTP